MKDGRDETFEADAVDEYDQAPDHEEAIVESAPDCLKTIEAKGKDTDICVAVATAAARAAVSAECQETIHQIFVREMEGKGGDGCSLGPPTGHLKRLRTALQNETRLQPNNAYRDNVAQQLDDSEICAITWSHIASRDAGRDTTVG